MARRPKSPALLAPSERPSDDDASESIATATSGPAQAVPVAAPASAAPRPPEEPDFEVYEDDGEILLERERERDRDPWDRGPGAGARTAERARQVKILAGLRSLKNTDRWQIRRLGPVTFRGQEVPVGVYPRRFHGPIDPTIIADAVGGGTYEVLLDGQDEWIGPIEILGAPRLDLELEGRYGGGNGNGNGSGNGTHAGTALPGGAAAGRHAARAGADADSDGDGWADEYDPTRGWIRVRRQRSSAVDAAVRAELDALRRAQEQQASQQSQQTQALAQALAGIAESLRQPREDPMARFLELERERLEQQRKDAEARRVHELEMLREQTKVERERLQQESKHAEQRAEMRTMLELLDKRKETDPIERIVSLIGTVKEVQELVAPAAAPPAGASALERVVEKLGRGLNRLYPSIEPAIQEAVKNMIQQQAGSPPGPGQPGNAHPGALPGPGASGATGSAGAGAPAAHDDAVGRLVREIREGMERGADAGEVWRRLQAESPRFARQLRACDSADELSEELRDLAASSVPMLARHADAIRQLADLVAGPHRAWADRLLAAANGRAPQGARGGGGV